MAIHGPQARERDTAPRIAVLPADGGVSLVILANLRAKLNPASLQGRQQRLCIPDLELDLNLAQ
jgi:hypothetical protein